MVDVEVGVGVGVRRGVRGWGRGSVTAQLEDAGGWWWWSAGVCTAGSHWLAQETDVRRCSRHASVGMMCIVWGGAMPGVQLQQLLGCTDCS